MYKNIICFFSFLLITHNVCISRMRESQRRPRCTHRGEIQIFSEPLLLHSAFMRLIQGHLKASNHLSFSSLLYFCEPYTGLSQGSKSSKFQHASQLLLVLYRAISRHQIILVFIHFSTCESHTAFSTSQPWAVYRKAST